MSDVRKLAVLGSPISHSKSPALHRAAYDRLGLSWQYSAVEMDGDRLGEFMGGLDAAWRGLSLTMPLKHDVLPLLDSIDDVAAITGAANTVLFDAGARRGFNTDVGGIVRTLREAGVLEVPRGVVLGGGATAASALVAMSELGAREVRVLVRRPGAAAPLVELGSRVGVRVDAGGLAELATVGGAELIVSTVPGGTDLGVA
ncbi:MAG: shikimate dehydrogenase family protein, partial [Agromyces sp.]